MAYTVGHSCSKLNDIIYYEREWPKQVISAIYVMLFPSGILFPLIMILTVFDQAALEKCKQLLLRE